MYAKSRLTCALMPKIGSSATEGCCRSAVANAICHAVGVPVVECIEGPLGETCVVEQSNLVVHASGHFEISEGKQCGGGTGTRGQRCHVSATTVARQLASQRCQARRCHPRPQSPQTYVTGVSPNGGNSIEQGLRKPEPFGNAEVLVNCRGAEPVLVRDKAPSKTRRSVQLPNY